MMIFLSSFIVIALASVIVLALAAAASAPDPLDLTEDLTSPKSGWPTVLGARPAIVMANRRADPLLPMITAAGLQ
jgi:hypothetical protein